MHHLARGGLLLLMTACAPAWGTGFCDTLPDGTGCSQIRSAERDLISGNLLPDFSDLDLLGHPFANYPIGFDLDFSQLSVVENTHVTVLELGFAGAPPDSRVLTMSVTRKSGVYGLQFDWLSADPLWSSASHPPARVTGRIAVAITAPEMSVGVMIAPSGSSGEDIFVGGQYVGHFGFPMEATPHHGLRLRTGVISGYFKDNTTTQYMFLSGISDA